MECDLYQGVWCQGPGWGGSWARESLRRQQISLFVNLPILQEKCIYLGSQVDPAGLSATMCQWAEDLVCHHMRLLHLGWALGSSAGLGKCLLSAFSSRVTPESGPRSCSKVALVFWGRISSGGWNGNVVMKQGGTTKMLICKSEIFSPAQAY